MMTFTEAAVLQIAQVETDRAKLIEYISRALVGLPVLLTEGHHFPEPRKPNEFQEAAWARYLDPETGMWHPDDTPQDKQGIDVTYDDGGTIRHLQVKNSCQGGFKHIVTWYARNIAVWLKGNTPGRAIPRLVPLAVGDPPLPSWRETVMKDLRRDRIWISPKAHDTKYEVDLVNLWLEVYDKQRELLDRLNQEEPDLEGIVEWVRAQLPRELRQREGPRNNKTFIKHFGALALKVRGSAPKEVDREKDQAVRQGDEETETQDRDQQYQEFRRQREALPKKFRKQFPNFTVWEKWKKADREKWYAERGLEEA